MRRLDMHIHTFASDGSYSPQQAIDEAEKIGLDFVCISDHDSVESVPEAMRLAKQKNIGITTAMEATSLYRGVEFHILGYGFDTANEEIRSHIEHTASVYDRRETDIMKEVVKLFPDKVSLEEYFKYVNDRTRGGFRTLNYMKDKGVLSNLGEYMKIKRSLTLPSYDYVSSEAAVDMFKSAGGFVVLAHPSYHYRGSVMDVNMLDSFRDMGIDGIECMSPYNCNEEQTAYYTDYCRKYSLAISGGSDCHGPYLTRLMGTPLVTDETADILERLGL